MRKCVSVKQRVTITVWFLATTTEYHTIAHLFGIAKCTVCEIVHETTGAIVNKLLHKYIKFPNGEQLQHLVDGFMKKCSVPKWAGAINGSHIPVKPPIQNHTDYYNRKGWYSVIIQTVVDIEYLFRDINVGGLVVFMMPELMLIHNFTRRWLKESF